VLRVVNVDFSNKKAKKIACDISSLKSIKNALGKINQPIDILINCAGIWLEGNLESLEDKEIENVIKTNLLGAIYISKEVYQKMLKQKSGQIINVCSTSAKKARDKETVYCASKWGLAGFTESLRLEARKHNIRVTAVFPGGMKTNLYQKAPEKNISAFMNPRYVAEQIVNLINSHFSICLSQLVIERT